MEPEGEPEPKDAGILTDPDSLGRAGLWGGVGLLGFTGDVGLTGKLGLVGTLGRLGTAGFIDLEEESGDKGSVPGRVQEVTLVTLFQ